MPKWRQSAGKTKSNMTRPNLGWKTEEDKVIIELWNTHTPKQISELIPRSAHNIWHRARTLGLARRASDWSDEEIDKLKTFYKVLTHNELAQLLGKTENAIHHKAERLGLFRYFSEWENRQMSPSIGHLLGMTLTDGYLFYNGNSGSLALAHSSVDREYVEFSMNAFADACGKNYRSARKVNMTNKIGKQVWAITLTCNELNHWIAEQTEWKKKFPSTMWDADRNSKLSFVAAMLDGDGFISESKQPRCSTLRYEIGFCSEDKWIFEFGDFLKSLGIQLRGNRKDVLKSGKDFYYITIDKETFVKSGGFFRINRKMLRLQRYVESHIDMFPQRPYAPPLPERMIWAGQHGDVLSVAEMSTPCQQTE